MGALGASSGVAARRGTDPGLRLAGDLRDQRADRAAVIFAGLRVIPSSRLESVTRHFDVTGAVLVTLSLVALTLGIVRTDTLGWGSAGVLGPLAHGDRAARRVPPRRGTRRRGAARAVVDLPHGAAARGELVVILLYASFFPVWFFLTHLPPAGARL